MRTALSSLTCLNLAREARISHFVLFGLVVSQGHRSWMLGAESIPDASFQGTSAVVEG